MAEINWQVSEEHGKTSVSNKNSKQTSNRDSFTIKPIIFLCSRKDKALASMIGICATVRIFVIQQRHNSLKFMSPSTNSLRKLLDFSLGAQYIRTKWLSLV